jgi:N-acetylmuramoyl-L-alanine amidase
VISLDRAGAESLSLLAPEPNWNRLEAFQQTITHNDFLALLTETYAPVNNLDWVRVESDRAIIQTGQNADFVLRFAPDRNSRRPVPRYWAPLLPSPSRAKRPLTGMTIAIDAGHLGGEWAKMEERWFQIGSAPPVMEGNLTLRVAQILVPRLAALGAQPLLVRSKLEPVTALRPGQLQWLARKDEARLAETAQSADPAGTDVLFKKEAERLFYRVAEIRARANRINDKLRPDLVLCLHFNAEPWGNPSDPTLVDANHLHLIINGDYTASETQNSDVRLGLLIKLLNRSHEVELRLSKAIASALARQTGLPPYHYPGSNAIPADSTGYIWTRNLLANRLYECPVIYVECYVMNSRSFFERFVAGEYPGLQTFDGVARPNIFTEYAEGIVEGLVASVQGN